MSWIGKASSDPRVFLINQTRRSRASPISQKAPVNFASAGVGSAAYVETKMLTGALKLPIKLITGYNGNDDQMAMRRGEIVGTIASRSSCEDFVKNGYGRFIAQIGGKDKDVPQLSTFIDTPNAKALVALIQSQGDIARLTAGPPAIPADRLEALRAAYKARGEQGSAGEGGKARRPVEPAYGEDVANLIKAALNQTPQTIEVLKEALKPAGGSSTESCRSAADACRMETLYRRPRLLLRRDAGCDTGVRARAAPDFYKGKTVTYIVGDLARRRLRHLRPAGRRVHADATCRARPSW